MSNTSSHPITVNGVRLDTWAYNIKVKQGWVGSAPLTGANTQTSGRHGELWTPGKRRGPGRMILAMWARGYDVDDVRGLDPYVTWRANMDTLYRLFDSTYKLLDVRQYLSPADTRQAFCEVKNSIIPTMVGSAYGELDVDLSIPNAFWQDSVEQTFTSPSGAGALGQHLLLPFVGTTAPMEDVYLVVDGPFNNPTLVDDATGHVLELRRNLSPTEQWVINSATWSSKVGTNIAFTDNGASATAQTVAYGPHLPRLFAIYPSQTPYVTLAGSGTGPTSRFRVRGRRMFH